LAEHEIFLSLAVAAAVGLLIGLERERSAGGEGARGTFPGGARTHPLVALAGALATLLSRSVGPSVVAIALGATVAFLALGYARDLRTGGERGMTSEIAFVVTFLLGAASTAAGVAPPERRFLAIAATAVVVTLLLSAKPILRPFAQRMSEDDVLAALKFLVLSVVVLPLLPDRELGPFAALNPFKLGVFVVLVAAVDFVGYVAIRLLGANRGLGVTGFVGGLASSTAVTLSMSARAKEEPAATTGCLLAILLAEAVMCLRVLGLVALAGPGLLGAVSRPLGAMAAVAFAGCGLAYARGRRHRHRGDLRITNPFELASALEFGAFFAVVLVGSKAAVSHLGAGGTYAAAFAAGLVDVDAITLSMAGLARGQVPANVAAVAIFVATASNTLFKAGMALVAGGLRFGRWVALAFGVTLVAGLAGAASLLRG
jgi:uncharacterized membrane protein (DUF4010 family)